MTTETDRVEPIAELATKRESRVVTAESLTSGSVATQLGAGPNAADWFGGGIVAYQEPVKFDVLGVEEGPVVTRACAEQMATGARRLLLSRRSSAVGDPQEYAALAEPAGLPRDQPRALQQPGDRLDLVARTELEQGDAAIGQVAGDCRDALAHDTQAVVATVDGEQRVLREALGL